MLRKRGALSIPCLRREHQSTSTNRTRGVLPKRTPGSDLKEVGTIRRRPRQRVRSGIHRRPDKTDVRKERKMRIEVLAAADAVARKTAAMIAREARHAVAARGSFHIAARGGHMAWGMRLGL